MAIHTLINGAALALFADFLGLGLTLLVGKTQRRQRISANRFGDILCLGPH